MGHLLQASLLVVVLLIVAVFSSNTHNVQQQRVLGMAGDVEAFVRLHQIS